MISEVHQLAAVTWRPEFLKNISVCESLKKLTNEDHFDTMQSADDETYSGPSHKPMKTG